MSDIAQLRLVLFMSRNMSLAAWDKAGILQRELAIYRMLSASGVDVSILSYGGSEERAYAGELGALRVLYNCWDLPARFYQIAAPWLHAWRLARAHVFKTNQIDGGLLAKRAARIWRKPLVVRCGYLWSDFRARAEGPDSQGALAARHIEDELFHAADRIALTTQDMAQEVSARYPHKTRAVRIIPNYVNTEQFAPDPFVETTTDLLFLGRLCEQKNISSLLQALAQLELRSTFIGDGPLSGLVQDFQRRHPGRLNWLVRVDHAQLPSLMRQSKVFVLPSLYEGHPKALIEAMACGCAVVAGDAPGIRSIVTDHENGLLCGLDSASIKQAISLLLGDEALRRKLGAAARQFATTNFSLNTVVGLEIDNLRQAANIS